MRENVSFRQSHRVLCSQWLARWCPRGTYCGLEVRSPAPNWRTAGRANSVRKVSWPLLERAADLRILGRGCLGLNPTSDDKLRDLGFGELLNLGGPCKLGTPVGAGPQGLVAAVAVATVIHSACAHLRCP